MSASKAPSHRTGNLERFFVVNSLSYILMFLIIFVIIFIFLLDKTLAKLDHNNALISSKLDDIIIINKNKLKNMAGILNDAENIFESISKVDDLDFILLNMDGSIAYKNPNKEIDLSRFSYLDNNMDKNSDIKQTYILSYSREKRNIILFQKLKDYFLLLDLSLKDIILESELDSYLTKDENGVNYTLETDRSIYKDIVSSTVIMDRYGFILASNLLDFQRELNFYDNLNITKFFYDLVIISKKDFYYLGKIVNSKNNIYVASLYPIRDLLYSPHLILLCLILIFVLCFCTAFLKLRKLFVLGTQTAVKNINYALSTKDINGLEILSIPGSDLHAVEQAVIRYVKLNAKYMKLYEESEQKLRSFFDTSRTAVLAIDSYTGDIIDANKAAVLFYGINKEALLQKDIYSLNADNSISLTRSLYESRKGRQAYIKTKHYTVQNGKNVDKDVRIYPFLVDSKYRYDYFMVIDFTAIDKATRSVDDESYYFKEGLVTAMELVVEYDEIYIQSFYKRDYFAFQTDIKSLLMSRFDLIFARDKDEKYYELKDHVRRINNNLIDAKISFAQDVYLIHGREKEAQYKLLYRFFLDESFRVRKIIVYASRVSDTLLAIDKINLTDSINSSKHNLLVVDENLKIIYSNKALLNFLEERNSLEGLNLSIIEQKLDVKFIEEAMDRLKRADSFYSIISNDFKSFFFAVFPIVVNRESRFLISIFDTSTQSTYQSYFSKHLLERMMHDIPSFDKTLMLKLLIFKMIYTLERRIDEGSYYQLRDREIKEYADYLRTELPLHFSNQLVSLIKQLLDSLELKSKSKLSEISRLIKILKQHQELK